jgi:hypothetical protein
MIRAEWGEGRERAFEMRECGRNDEVVERVAFDVSGVRGVD